MNANNKLIYIQYLQKTSNAPDAERPKLHYHAERGN